jgi:uncharacterized protein YhaN
MRLNRLDLTRYGHFTGHVIDFGVPAAGRPDLHIIYGPNETGKSTAFAAFLDLLFGIEPRSRFNFLHPYQTMRIGASLQLEQGPRELLRIKKPQNSLLDGNERSISEAVILGELGGLDREAYRDMFSLDDATLEAGGESILASKGNLGELLFSASTGLADLSRGLIAMRAEADGFYKPRARNVELPQLKAQLAELKQERAEIDTFANDYAQLVETRERARVHYEEAIAERGRTQSRIDEIQRHLSALPRLAALRGIREKLAPLSGLPDAPLGWLDELPKLQAEEIELVTRAETISEEIAKIAAELEAITVDDETLHLAARIDSLAEPRARYVTAEKDLPERRLQSQEQARAIAGLLKRVGKSEDTDPARLVLNANAVGALRDLIETRSGVEASVATARSEVSEASDRLEEARARHLDASGGTAGARKREAQIAALAATVTALRAGDHTARRRVAERARGTYREMLAERISELRPWKGDADQLASLAVPEAADIERWKEALAHLQKQIERHETEIERLDAEKRRLRAERDAISRIAGVASDLDAARVRAEREEAWANHRSRLDDSTATAFEAALRRDDIVVNTRLSNEKEFAKLHQASERLAVVEADLAHRNELLEAAQANRESVVDEIATALAAIVPPLPANFTVAKLEAWLTRREKALEMRAGLTQAESDLALAEADISAARTALSGALEALSVPCVPEADFDALLADAQSTLDRETELKALRTAVQDRERELKTRERALKKAVDAEAAWSAAWSKVCSASWLGEGGKAPAVAAVREILAALAELGPAVEGQAGLADRIRKMEIDCTAFAKEVSAIALELGQGAAGKAPLDLAHEIGDRLQQARIAQSAKAARSEALDAARMRQRDLDETAAIHRNKKAQVTAFFAVDSLAEAGARLQEIGRKAGLEKLAEEAARDILDALRLPSLEAAEAALDAADRAAIERELAELKARLEDQDRRTHELFSDHRKAADRVEAVGGDDAAARIEERRRTLLLDIEEKALRYLRLRVGIVAAEQALHLYRDQHRSSMMARASAAFRTISRNAYRSLTTQLDKDSETLIALAADGSSKVTSDLSKGARFQLYLALRVAGYYEFTQTHRPVPFVADDILEAFDDFRAEETFRVFADMARVGQVIYLTHHRHLCEIAERICPSVRVHDLTAPPPQAKPMTSAA